MSIFLIILDMLLKYVHFYDEIRVHFKDLSRQKKVTK
jgi:hypothetical protein